MSASTAATRRRQGETAADVHIHATAEVSPQARLGAGTWVWNQAQIREEASLGERCIVGKDVYIDRGVVIGNHVKIQNSSLLYQGLTVEDGVFIGPRVCFTNDRFPRAIQPDGELKGPDDWQIVKTRVRYGASVGAGAVVVAGIVIGRFAMVGAGAVVTRDVPDFGLVVGVPARLIGYVCLCGHRLVVDRDVGWCPSCRINVDLSRAT